MCGCSGLEPSTPEELARFEEAGPYRPKVDSDAIVAAKLCTSSYRVAPGDILQFEMPTVMRALSVDADGAGRTHSCRVSSEGKITLPMVGEVEAAGKALDEIERTAVDAYYPRFAVHRPAIVATAAPVVAASPARAVRRPASPRASTPGQGRRLRAIYKPLFYPPGARDRGLFGRARVEMLIDASGHVTSVSLVASSGSTELDQAAVSSARQWRFQPPGERRRVRTWLVFRLS